jgi:predicted transcriptional regulator
MAVVGTATLTNNETDSPERIWRRHRRNLGLEHHEYGTYLEGAGAATALTITAPERLLHPHTLASLREETGFRPPQSSATSPHSIPRPYMPPSVANQTSRHPRMVTVPIAP